MNMKKYLMLIIAACSLFVAQSCKEVSNQMDPDYPADYDVNYALREVLEIDPVNVNGIDVMPYFEFFNDFRFVIHYKDGKISSCEISNGSIPFSPYSFDVPEGEVECYFDTERVPNAIRLTSTDQIVACYTSGEFYIPFKLDCQDIDYEYYFKAVE